MLDKIKRIIISLSTSLLDAMKQMDEVKVKTLMVFENGRFEGLVTIGDIQRAIINNIALQEPVSHILNKKKVYGYQLENEDVIKDKMRKMRAEVMPILNNQDELVDVWFWDDLFKKTELLQREKVNLPVVILAALFIEVSYFGYRHISQVVIGFGHRKEFVRFDIFRKVSNRTQIVVLFTFFNAVVLSLGLSIVF